MNMSPEAVAELQSMRQSDKHLSPQDVLDRARSANSALHGYFTWDDTEAARRYRLLQAMEVIKAVVRITYRPPPPPAKVVVSAPKPAQAQQPTAVYHAPKMDYESALGRLQTDIMAIMPKYLSVPEMEPVFNSIIRFLTDRIDARRANQKTNKPDQKIVEIAAALDNAERKVMLMLPRDGLPLKVPGPAVSLIIGKIRQRYPTDIISVHREDGAEIASLTQIGRLVRGRIAQAEAA